MGRGQRANAAPRRAERFNVGLWAPLYARESVSHDCKCVRAFLCGRRVTGKFLELGLDPAHHSMGRRFGHTLVVVAAVVVAPIRLFGEVKTSIIVQLP